MIVMRLGMDPTLTEAVIEIGVDTKNTVPDHNVILGIQFIGDPDRVRSADFKG